MQQNSSSYNLDEYPTLKIPSKCSSILLQVDEVNQANGLSGKLSPRISEKCELHRLLTIENFIDGVLDEDSFDQKELSVIVTGPEFPFVDLVDELERINRNGRRKFVAIATIKAALIWNDLQDMGLIPCVDPFPRGKSSDPPKNHALIVCNKNSKQLLFLKNHFRVTIPLPEKRDIHFQMRRIREIISELADRMQHPCEWESNHSLIFRVTAKRIKPTVLERFLDLYLRIFQRATGH